MSSESMRQLQNKMRELEARLQDDFVLQSDRKVFISYSSKDRTLAEKVCSGLQLWGHGIWLDRVEMEDDIPDSEIEARLYSGISTANCLVLLLSRHSVESNWVKKEYTEALRQSKVRDDLLLLIGTLDNSHVPAQLTAVKRIDFQKDFQSAVLDVVANFGITMRKRRDEPASSGRPQQRHPEATQHASSVLAYNEGNLLFQQGQLEAAIKKWDVAIKLDPGNSDALYQSACALYELALRSTNTSNRNALLHDVIERYEKLLKTRGHDVDALINLAAAYRSCEATDSLGREFELLTAALDLAPNNGLVFLNFGHFFSKYGGCDELAAHLSEVYEKGSANVSVNLGYLNQALDAYVRAEQCDPNLSDTCREMAEGVKKIIDICARATLQ